MNYLRRGTYEVYWENKNSRVKITSKIEVRTDILLNDVSTYFKNNIITYHSGEGEFDKFKERPYKIIEEYVSEKDSPIRIIAYNDENTINDLLRNGYTIREFLNDKCILEYGKKETL